MNLVYIVGMLLVFSWAQASVSQKNCQNLIGELDPAAASRQYEALATLHHALPEMFGPGIQQRRGYQLLENFALLKKTRNVVAVVLGGANVGKSTLISGLGSLLRGDPKYMINRLLTEPGLEPGLTKQMLVVTSGRDKDGSLLEDLKQRYGELKPWTSKDDTTVPGPGLIVALPDLPDATGIVDAPDFDSRKSKTGQPDNLEAAMRVICPADVLIAIFTMQNIFSSGNLDLLQHIFQSYGSKKTILILQAPPILGSSEVNGFLIKLANMLYDTEGNQYPEGVLGAYLMPTRDEVLTKKEHPQLNRLDEEFPTFPDLIGNLSRRSAEIKHFGFRNAIETIKTDVDTLIREKLKGQLAMGLYQQALKALIESAASDTIQEFDYEAVQDKIRSRFRFLRSKLAQKTHFFETLIGGPLQLYREAKREIPFFKQFAPSANDPEWKPLRENHRVHDKAAVNHLIIQLAQKTILLDPDNLSSSAKTLVSLAEAYYKLFPEEKTEFEEQDGNKLKVQLPREDLLSPEARKALRVLLNVDRDALEKQLSEELDKAQFNVVANSAESDGEIARVLDNIRPNRWQTLSSDALSLGTVTVPFVMVGLARYIGLDFVLFDLAAFFGTSRSFYVLNDHFTDRYLKAKLNEWFHHLQHETTAFFFDEKTKPLNAVLAWETNQQQEGIQRLQRALQELDPDYNPLPVSLSALRARK